MTRDMLYLHYDPCFPFFPAHKGDMAAKTNAKGGDEMKQEEKKPLSWEIADPKPPVIQSGHLENRKQQAEDT